MEQERTTIDQGEVDRFAALAREWWNPDGKFGVLHKFNPVRLAYIRDHVCAHFGRDAKARRSLEGLSLVDIGCGGGLLTEPMARLGADALGLDPAEKNVEVARIHAAGTGASVEYRATTAEALAAEGARFDVVLAMEVVEHVADLDLFVRACGTLAKPGGLVFVATINRTAKAYALAILGAEYVLRWLPRGTHSYDKLVRPEELDRAFAGAGLERLALDGVAYSPLRDEWRLSRDTDVNYMMVAQKRA